MVQTSKRFWQILAVSLALSAAALAWLLPSAFSADSWQQLSRVSPWGLGLLLIALCARWLCGGWRTAILARLTGADLSVLQGVRCHVMGTFSSVITPAGSGNALGMTWLLHHYGVALPKAVLVNLLVTVTDMSFFSWSVPLSVLWLYNRGVELPLARPLWTVAGFMAFAIAASLLLSLRLRWLIAVVRWLSSWSRLTRWRKGLLTFLQQLEEASVLFVQTPWHVHIKLHAVSALFWCVRFAVFNAAAVAVGLVVGQLELLAAHDIIHALAFLVPTPGASGYVEAAFGWLLAGLANPEKLAAAVILWRLISYYLYFILGPLIGSSVVNQSLWRKQHKQAPNLPEP
ncbi:MAG: lysylphosphatidylglycerol synthase transmembrane domain-containing protein [Deinococcota bacterium]